MLRRVTSTWRCTDFRLGAIRFSCLGATSNAVTTGSQPVTKPGHAVGALQYDNSKAGLQTVNVDHVQKVIMEATEGSAFYLHEQKREAARSERTKRVLEDAQKYAALPECEKAVYDQRAAQTEKELRGTFSLDKRYVHVDMDMFYAAVEEKRDPSLTEIPFAVGSHSMLCTSNYVARKYGVRSGMPGFIAKKLCPFLRIVPPDFDHYKSIAADVRAIGRRYDVNFVSVGLDELTMEVSGYMTRHRLPMGKSGVAEVCERFRREVFQTTGLTCTAGAGLTSAVAKMASNVNKPDGQHVVELKSHAALMKHFDRIPLRTIPGIGYAQDSTLGALGLTACGDLLPKRALLCYLFREKTFTFYMSIALGLVRTHVERTLDASKTLSGSVRSAKRRLPKSISKEKTRRSICGEAAMSKLCLGLLADAHESLLREHLLVQTVTLYVKTHEFVSHSYARTLPTPCNNLETLWKHLQELLVPLVSSEGGYRLLGVRLTKFTNSRGGRPSKKDLTLQVKKQHKLATKLQSHLPSPPTIKKSTVIVAKPAKHRRVGA